MSCASADSTVHLPHQPCDPHNGLQFRQKIAPVTPMPLSLQMPMHPTPPLQPLHCHLPLPFPHQPPTHLRCAQVCLCWFRLCLRPINRCRSAIWLVACKGSEKRAPLTGGSDRRQRETSWQTKRGIIGLECVQWFQQVEETL